MLLKGSRTFLNKFSPSRYYYSSMSKDTKRSFKFAAIQLKVTDNKSINLKSATEKIKEASLNGAKVVALPVFIYIFISLKKNQHYLIYFKRNASTVHMEIHIFLFTVRKHQEKHIHLFQKQH